MYVVQFIHQNNFSKHEIQNLILLVSTLYFISVVISKHLRMYMEKNIMLLVITIIEYSKRWQGDKTLFHCLLRLESISDKSSGFFLIRFVLSKAFKRFHRFPTKPKT